MTAMRLIWRLLKEEPQAGTKLTSTQEAAKCIVRCLLDESPWAEALVSEATVHRPTRSRERAKMGRSTAKSRLRVRRSAPGTTSGPLTQREIAILLNLSERGVRAIERRAFQKLLNHPSLREVWRQYLAGELDEDQWNLTPEEITAVFTLTRTAQEWLLLKKVTRVIQR